MNILSKTATMLGCNGDEKNIELAALLSKTENLDDILEIVENLENADKNIQSDCIKVLYELGYIKPVLISKFYEKFVSLLSSKNNRLIWGGMIALMTIAPFSKNDLIKYKNEILKATMKGSVITQDAGIAVISHLHQVDNSNELLVFLQKHFTDCEAKQIPLRLEKMTSGLTLNLALKLSPIIETRFPELNEKQLIRTKKILGF